MTKTDILVSFTEVQYGLVVRFARGEKGETMSERYCETCYYEDFDPFAYPCAMCIRGYERTDKWKPKEDEPQTERSS